MGSTKTPDMIVGLVDREIKDMTLEKKLAFIEQLHTSLDILHETLVQDMEGEYEEYAHGGRDDFLE